MSDFLTPAHDPPSNSPLKTKGGGPDRERCNILVLFIFSVLALVTVQLRFGATIWNGLMLL